MKKKFNDSVTGKEFFALLPFYIGCFVILCVISLVLLICKISDYTLFTGAAAGTAVSMASFIAMGKSAEGLVYVKDSKKAQTKANVNYAIRYILTLLVLGVLMYFKLVNPITALIPLFVPKIAYFILAMKKKNS